MEEAKHHIPHFDLDSFFASVALSNTPSLKGKPVSVRGYERDIVASCRHAARNFGLHSARPMTTSDVSPECPRDFGELGVSALGAQINEALLEGCARSISRIAPHLAVGLFRLFIRRGEKGAVVFFGERLPMQIKGTGEARFA